ncbi:hypothetical protein GUITHDRAFT_144371 [Guillardia theta CCMP2712]|uniref:26S proteasome non-ATPase regulatory subunit 9 n=1 Tax=Guillardia theta (strain CCMP2712) TaxID=905079 RepID=L1IPU0_GUITC|nr:hypothetical protein GUITHDRAFT_144371 [Guillardia theta CCMP2712]EKX38263.1 hypothetical protein GUITHDRAFT_144371 [Guillardia theta CCMP2712]|eukprot:XP_005825243.1 hypothetical protein GUITHDRAFT_144371 [Guillardia theta CCMP2712]
MANDEEELQKLFALQDKARAIESEIAQLIDVLDNMPGKPGLNGRLVDKEGFPRADVDVHTARIHRNRIACLQTDHKSIMQQVEKGLFEHHSRVKEGRIAPRHSAPIDSAASHRYAAVAPVLETQKPLRPFAVKPPSRLLLVVDEVSSDSPAQTAGLQVGDRVLAIGDVEWTAISRQGMQALAAAVQESKDRDMAVVVMREGEARTTELTLRPQVWSGRGLLGCHLNPLPLS